MFQLSGYDMCTISDLFLWGGICVYLPSLPVIYGIYLFDICRPLRYEKVYLPLGKVSGKLADTPFHI